jgi:Gas vesicle synthesis protein GvpL/GvpF
VNAIYLYCLVKAARKPSITRMPAGLPGGTRPEILQLGRSLWLVVGEVPLDTYGSGRLEEHLADLDWVGHIALAHEAVVEHFAGKPGLTVVPMKLFTMFSTRERALADIGNRQPEISVIVRRIAGAQEWGIRVTHRAGEAGRAALAQRTATGAEFLAAKKRARDAATHAKAAAAESAIAAYRRLSRLARESRMRADAPPSAAPPPLLDASFLVPAAKRARFTQAAKREAAECAKAGAQVTLSGPWPAYNFVDSGARRS